MPHLKPAPVRAQIAEIKANHDHIRSWLLAEPRGYAGMTGAILMQSPDPGIDYGVIFTSSSGYKPMSGHGMIALATTLIDTGAVRIDGPDTRITFDTFAGPFQARAEDFSISLVENEALSLKLAGMEIAGRGQVNGMHQFFIDPSDPMGQGFGLL